ncbi:MAG: LamG-like jellyroll fold domain-containing protein [Candidatus Hatepunaea meridiana]|nr:LamG-like jellyroll fold domain-containing protein [Candidatus Hatepunaea meridiana]
MSISRFIIPIIILLSNATSSFSQLDTPFSPDEYTRALWHIDQSQPDSLWAVTFGTENREFCRDAVRTSDGNYAIVGYTISVEDGNKDILLAKMNDDGETLLSRTYGTDEVDFCYSMLELENGNLALGCTAGERRHENFVLLIVDADGDSLWSQTYGGENGETCNVIFQDDDGGFLLGGHTYTFSNGLFDLWVVKTNSEGDMIWAVPFGGEQTESCYTIAKTEDNGYLLGGYTSSDVESSEGWIIKVNQRGNFVWERKYGSIHSDRIKVIIPSDDGYVCAGYSYANFWLFEIDEDGEILWEEVYPGLTYYSVFDAIQTVDNGYVLAGAYRMVEEGYDFGMMKTDRYGQRAWTRNFGGGEDDKIYSIIQTDDYGYMLFGNTESFGEGEEDCLIIRIDADLIYTSDVSGNANHCLPVGTCDTCSGRWGNALELTNNTHGAFLIEDDESLQPEQFTVEGWFLMSDTVQHTGALLTKVLEIEYTSYMLYVSSEYNTAGFLLNTDVREYSIECDVDPADDEWHHIAGTYNGEMMQLFYDGISYGEIVAAGDVLYDDCPLIIGSDDYTRRSDFQFYGKIDEVRLSDVIRDHLDAPIADNNRILPASISLIETMPNPFNGQVLLKIELKQAQDVRIDVYNLSGRHIVLLGEGSFGSGEHILAWDVADLANGIYLAKIRGYYGVCSVRMVLVK